MSTERGFTILELVIVLGVVGILVVIAVPRILGSFVAGGDQTRDDAFEIKHLFDTARHYAVANRENADWGIRIVDNGTTDCGSTTSVDCVVMYKGSEFATRETDYDTRVILRGANRFSTYDMSDFYFQRISGHLMNIRGFVNDPLAWYTFERSTTTDTSGNGYHGVPSGSLNYFANNGVRGSTQVYGNGGYIDIPNTLLGSQNTTGLTFAASGYFPNTTYDFAIVGGAPNDSYNFYASGGLWYDNGVPTMSCYDGASYQHAVSPAALDANGWHHIVGTYDPSDDSLALYIDGDLADSTTCTSITEGMTESYIGYNAKSTDRMLFSSAALDDVMIFDRPLTATEIYYLSRFSRTTSTYEFVPSTISITDGSATSTVALHSTGVVEVLTEAY